MATLAFAMLAIGCAGDHGTTTASTRSATRFATQPATPITVVYPAQALPPTPSPPPTAPPTPSPTPVPIHHPPPYTVVIDAGHGGPHYWGASAYDANGNRYIEKDLALEIALRVYDLLLADEQGRYAPLLTRDGDYTLMYFDAGQYRPSLIAEQQARVDLANFAQADMILSIHFNSWFDAGQRGTETYCNPDRPFGNESCNLAWFVQDALVRAVREAGYDVYDRGTKNDAEVGGDPGNPHSFLLGTNRGFNPSFMPGVISEVLFLSHPADLEFVKQPEAFDIIARGYKAGIDAYFAWLNG
jgi:N-acetylmuramoyl-L-alanine amidase